MPLQPKTYGKSSERACGDAAAGRDVPISALDLPFFFDTMENKNEIVNIEGEIWEDVVGFEGLYKVSNKGRIKRIKIKGKDIDRILHPTPNRDGYLLVSLSKNGIVSKKQLHRIVYLAFNGTIPEYEIFCDGKGNGDNIFVINHKDENPSNNCVENLEIVSVTYNNNYGTRIKKSVLTRSKKVYQYSINGCFIKEWGSATMCNKNGFSRTRVSECCKAKILSYKGFLWSYTPLSEKELEKLVNSVKNNRKCSQSKNNINL